MSKTFKWMVVKAATAVARNVSTNFFNLYYREMVREIYSLTKDPKITVKYLRSIGRYSARESAERRRSVLQLFPKDPVKILDYLPILWEVYFGAPMGDYEKEWDKSDPNHPAITYTIKDVPLIYGIMKKEDPELDNLPWEQFYEEEDGYMAMISGLLTEVSNFILEIKGQPYAISIKQVKGFLHNDGICVIKCTIMPKDEYTEKIMNLGKTEADFEISKSEEAVEKIAENILGQLGDKISLDKIEELFESPTSGVKSLMRMVSDKVLHMEVGEVLGHFKNYEDYFFKILGWLYVHIFNELGRIPENIFKNQKVARLFGHVFLMLKRNATQFIPLSVMEGFRDYFAQIYEELGGEDFAEKFRNYSGEEIVDLMLQGAQKAFQDLGVPFNDLEPTLFEEIRQINAPQGVVDVLDYDEFKDKRAALMEQLFEQLFVIGTAIFSIPAQLGFLLLYNALSTGNEMIVNLFNSVKTSSEKTVEIIEKLRELEELQKHRKQYESI